MSNRLQHKWGVRRNRILAMEKWSPRFFAHELWSVNSKRLKFFIHSNVTQLFISWTIFFSSNNFPSEFHVYKMISYALAVLNFMFCNNQIFPWRLPSSYLLKDALKVDKYPKISAQFHVSSKGVACGGTILTWNFCQNWFEWDLRWGHPQKTAM